MLDPPGARQSHKEVSHHSWSQIPELACQPAYFHRRGLGGLWPPSYSCNGWLPTGRVTTSCKEGPLKAQDTCMDTEGTASSGAQLRHCYPPVPSRTKSGWFPLRKIPRVQRCHLLGLTLALLPQAEGVKAEPFENHSALEIAEQLTLLDHLVFKKIPYE